MYHVQQWWGPPSLKCRPAPLHTCSSSRQWRLKVDNVRQSNTAADLHRHDLRNCMHRLLLQLRLASVQRIRAVTACYRTSSSPSLARRLPLTTTMAMLTFPGCMSTMHGVQRPGLHLAAVSRPAGIPSARHSSWSCAPYRHTPRRCSTVPAAAGGGSGSGSGSGSQGGGSGGGSGKGDSSGGDGGLWGAYLRALEASPLLVKAITSAVLSAVGNLVCQVFIEGKKELDWRRFSIFTGLGFFFVAPALHFWFGALNKIVPNPGTQGALMRMALDQFAYAPVFIASMMAILQVLDGKPGNIASTLKNDWPSAIRANWGLWVPAQFLNFRFVPPQHQVLCANVTALVWNVYFSFATRPKEEKA